MTDERTALRFPKMLEANLLALSLAATALADVTSTVMDTCTRQLLNMQPFEHLIISICTAIVWSMQANTPHY